MITITLIISKHAIKMQKNNNKHPYTIKSKNQNVELTQAIQALQPVNKNQTTLPNGSHKPLTQGHPVCTLLLVSLNLATFFFYFIFIFIYF